MKNNKIDKIKLNYGILSPITVCKNIKTGFYESICDKYRVGRLSKSMQALVLRRFALFAERGSEPEGNPEKPRDINVYNVSNSTGWLIKHVQAGENRPGIPVIHTVRHIHNTYIQSSGHNPIRQPGMETKHGAAVCNALTYKEFNFKPNAAEKQNTNKRPDSEADRSNKSPVLINLSVNKQLWTYGQEHKALLQETGLIKTLYRETEKGTGNKKTPHQGPAGIRRIITTINVQGNKTYTKYLPNETLLKAAPGYPKRDDKEIHIYKSKDTAGENDLADITRLQRPINRGRLSLYGSGTSLQQAQPENAWNESIIEQAAEFMTAKPAVLLKTRVFHRNSIKKVKGPDNSQPVSGRNSDNSGAVRDRLHEEELILNSGSGEINPAQDDKTAGTGRNLLKTKRLKIGTSGVLIKRSLKGPQKKEFDIDGYANKLEYFDEPELGKSMTAETYGLYEDRHTENVLRHSRDIRDGNIRESAAYPGNRPENISTGDKGYVNNSRLVFNTPPRNEVSAVKPQSNYVEGYHSEVASTPGNLNVPLQQRKSSNLEQREINILAEQVLKILEKRIAIQKDRRGLL